MIPGLVLMHLYIKRWTETLARIKNPVSQYFYLLKKQYKTRAEGTKTKKVEKIEGNIDKLSTLKFFNTQTERFSDWSASMSSTGRYLFGSFVTDSFYKTKLTHLVIYLLLNHLFVIYDYQTYHQIDPLKIHHFSNQINLQSFISGQQKMLQQINLINHLQMARNPQNQAFCDSLVETKKKKKKFKIKKCIKSPTKHHHLATNDLLYQALNYEDIISTDQLNFGPWIKQELKPQEQFFPIIDKQQHTLNLKTQQNSLKQPIFFQNKQMSKSQQFLSKFKSLKSSRKLQKVSNRNGAQFKVPVWNAFIEQQQKTSLSAKNLHQSLRNGLINKRQPTLNFEISKKKTKLNFVQIGSNEELNTERKIKFNSLNREDNNFQLPKMKKIQGYSKKKLQQYKKLKTNPLVQDYYFQDKSRLTPKLTNLKQMEKQMLEKRVENSLRNKNHEIFDKKLNDNELKLVIPEQKSKLIFLLQSERPAKPTLSRYLFMELLEMRANKK